MSKILDATCLNSQVTVEGTVIEAEIFSEGMKQSSGAALFEKDKVYYLTSNATDIKELIESLVIILNQIIIITTALDAVTLSPGSATAAITQLTLLKTQLDLTKENLK